MSNHPPASTNDYWERVYKTKPPTEVSWFQNSPNVSLGLIKAGGIRVDTPIIDVGGGASTLVDHLLAGGYKDLTVLDIAPASLRHARERLGERAAPIQWIAADITAWQPPRRYGLWHDRAVFHFLTESLDRDAYKAVLETALGPRGQLIIATFAPDGPVKCSGLEVQRYDPESLARELGPGFELRQTTSETHVTPVGGKQAFVYCRFRRL